MNIKLCIGDLSSMLGCRGKYKLLKAVRLQSHPLRMCPQDMAALGEQREGPCAGLVSSAFSHCTLGGLCLLKSPFTAATLGFLSPPNTFYFGFGKICVGKTLFCDICLCCLFWCGDMHGCFTRLASYRLCALFFYIKD